MTDSAVLCKCSLFRLVDGFSILGTILVIVLSQVVMSAIGIAFLFLIMLTGDAVLTGDPVMQLVVLLFFCTPPNVGLLAVAVVNGFQEAQLGRLVVHSYVAAIVTVTLSCVVYIELLKGPIPSIFH